MKRTILFFSTLVLLVAVFTLVGKTLTQERVIASDTTDRDQWEYLVVAGASNNLSPSSNPSLRKEPAGPFGREAFVLEQQMDKLGAKGWELVSVSGSASDPIYYFKRRK